MHPRRTAICTTLSFLLSLLAFGLVGKGINEGAFRTYSPADVVAR